MIWRTKKLGDVCDAITRGISPKYINVGGVIILNQKCIRDHKISYQEARKHDSLTKSFDSKKLIRIGDVLVNSTGTGTLGRVAQVKSFDEPTLVDSHITIVRPIKGLFDINFFGWGMIYIEDLIKQLGAGASGQTELSRETLKQMAITYPESISDQHRIVKVLDEVFEKTAKVKVNAEKNFQNAKELFESYLQNVFADPGKDWEEKRLDEIIESNVIGLVKNSREQSSDNKYMYVKMNNITRDNRLDLAKYTRVDATKLETEKFSLQVGDFLFNTRNSYELVGKTCIFEGVDEVVILYNNNIMRVRFVKNVSPYFINYAFSSRAISKELGHLKSGTTNVSAIYYKDLKNLILPIPFISEQKSIVAKLDALSDETKKLEAIYKQKLTDLEELKESVLKKAFSGQL